MCHDEKDDSDAAGYHAGIDPRLKQDFQKITDGVVAPGDEQLSLSLRQPGVSTALTRI